MRWFLVLAIAAAPLAAWQLFERGAIWFQAPSRDVYPVRGIDVSHHNGAVDWGAIEGVSFAYVKATEGGDFVDTRFTENWAGARRAGLRRGAYHFFTFCRSGADQAAGFLSVVPVDADALPPAIDIELGGNCAERPSWAWVEAELTAMIDAMTDRYGEAPILYVTEELLALYPVERLGRPLWVRSIYTAPRRPWAIWQYHCRARITGIDGPVDLNVADEAWFERAALRGTASRALRR